MYFQGTELDKAILNKLLLPVIEQQTGFNLLEIPAISNTAIYIKTSSKLAERVK